MASGGVDDYAPFQGRGWRLGEEDDPRTDDDCDDPTFGKQTRGQDARPDATRRSARTARARGQASQRSEFIDPSASAELVHSSGDETLTGWDTSEDQLALRTYIVKIGTKMEQFRTVIHAHGLRLPQHPYTRELQHACDHFVTRISLFITNIEEPKVDRLTHTFMDYVESTTADFSTQYMDLIERLKQVVDETGNYDAPAKTKKEDAHQLQSQRRHIVRQCLVACDSVGATLIFLF